MSAPAATTATNKYVVNKLKLKKQQSEKSAAAAELKSEYETHSADLIKLMKENSVKVCPVVLYDENEKPRYLVVQENRPTRKKTPCPSNVKAALRRVKPLATVFDSSQSDTFKHQFLEDFGKYLDTLLQPSISDPKLRLVTKLPKEASPSDVARGEILLQKNASVRKFTAQIAETIVELEEINEEFKPVLQDLQKTIKDLEADVAKEHPIPEDALSVATTVPMKAPPGQPKPLFELVTSKKVEKVKLEKEEVLEIITTMLDGYLKSQKTNNIVQFDLNRFVNQVVEELTRRSVKVLDDETVVTFKPVKRPCNTCQGSGHLKKVRFNDTTDENVPDESGSAVVAIDDNTDNDGQDNEENESEAE